MNKRTNWDRIAEKQFKAMPKDYQEGWRDLLEHVNKRKLK